MIVEDKNQRDQVRQRLDEMLAQDGLRPTNDLEWAELDREDGFVEDVFEDGTAYTRMLNTVRRRRRAYGATSTDGEAEKLALTLARKRRREAARPNTERHWHEAAISAVLAAFAVSDTADGHGRDVRRFRAEILEDRLLSYEDKAIKDWIASQDQKRESGPIVLVEKTLPSAKVFGKMAGYLEYATPEADWVQRIPVMAGTVLDRLRQLSEKLASYYPWSKDQATAFVLTGVQPWVSSIRMETKIRTPVFARSRIKLIVDPACTPQEVAAAYAQVRREDFPFVSGRVRRLSEKHARLAAFVVEHPEEPGPKMLDDWNQLCVAEGKGERWKYIHLSQFVRDAKRAVDRLLNFGFGESQTQGHRSSDTEG